MKKSQIAGILFGVAMGVLFSVSLGTVGFALGASLANLGMVMFEGLDDPPDKKVECKKNAPPLPENAPGRGGVVCVGYSSGSSSSGSSSMVNTAFFSLPQPWAFRPDL